MQALLDQDDGEPARRLKSDDDVFDLIDDRRLDAFGRFIQQQYFWIGEQGTSDCQLLLLSSAQDTTRPLQNLRELGKRLTDVQQPNTTATLSCTNNCLAFSANRSQLEAGSTITGFSGRPNRPPFALISSTAIETTSFKDTSLIAMVPLRECKTPILIGASLSTP